MEEDFKSEQLEILQKQKIALVCYLIPIGLSYLIINEEQKRLKGEETYFTSEEIEGLTLINRVVSLVLVIYFGYTIYLTLKLLKKYHMDYSLLTIQLVSSTLTIIAATLSLLTTLYSFDTGVVESEVL